MRFNPPPNWPPPPPDWEPPASWTPDPAWPPPPPGWQLFIDDDPPGTPAAHDPEPEPAAASPLPSAVPASLIEIAPDQLTIDHVGTRAIAKWDDEDRYKIGTIVGVSADAATITVALSGSAAITFPRHRAGDAQAGPRLFIST